MKNLLGFFIGLALIFTSSLAVATQLLAPRSKEKVDLNKAYLLKAKADDEGLIKVEFLLDSRNVVCTSTENIGNYPGDRPMKTLYGCLWTPKTPGDYRVSARAFYEGKVAYSGYANITVPELNKGPVVRILKPENKSVVEAKLPNEVLVSASDSDGVSRVELYSDGVRYATDLQAPYEFTWIPSDVKNYKLRAVAYDKKGVSSHSGDFSIDAIEPNYPPEVSIPDLEENPSFPVRYSTLINIRAIDDTGIRNVTLYIDGEVKANFNSPQYQAKWIPKEEKDYEIYAVAYDVEGKKSNSKKYKVTVYGEANPTTAKIKSPYNTEEFLIGNTYPVTTRITDGDGVDKVELYVDAELIDTSTSYPYDFEWGPEKEGKHSLYIRAYDSLGNVKQSDVVQIRAKYPVPEITDVKLVSPTNGSTFYTGDVIELEAEVIADSDIVKVEFYIDGSFWSSESQEPYKVAWSPEIDKTYNIMAKAFDNQSNEVSSDIHSVTILEGTLSNSAKITAPLSNQRLLKGRKTVVKANVVGDISHLELYINDELFETAYDAPFEFDWLPEEASETKLYLRAVYVDGSDIKSSTVNVSVIGTNPNILVFEEDFEEDSSHRYHQYSIASDSDWDIKKHGDGRVAQISGYGADEASEDWLILEPIALNDYEQEVLSFDSASNYSGPILEVKYSTDYSAEYDPDPYSVYWNDIPECKSSKDEPCWATPKNSGLEFEKSHVDISSISGDTVSFAFVYLSYGTRGGDGRLWAVDNISVKATDQNSLVEIESFENGIPGNWAIWSDDGQANWVSGQWLRESSAVLPGYGAEEAGKEWLIMPVANIDSAISTKLQFDYYRQYPGPGLGVFVSTDYKHGQDPNNSAWREISFIPSLHEDTWATIGPLDLSHYDGNLSIAFTYESEGTGPGEGANLGIDNVELRIDF